MKECSSEAERIKAVLVGVAINHMENREDAEGFVGLFDDYSQALARESIANRGPETAVRADGQTRVRETIARAIESQINEADLSAGQSAANEALRMAARIARGE